MKAGVNIAHLTDGSYVTFHNLTQVRQRVYTMETIASDMSHDMRFLTMFFLFLILLRPLNNLSVMRDGSSWVEPVLSQDQCVLLKDHNAVTPVRLEPAALRS